MIKQKQVTCDDVFEFFTSSGLGNAERVLVDAKIIEEHLANCRECCEFAQSTSSVVESLRRVAGILETCVVESDKDEFLLRREPATHSSEDDRKFESLMGDIDQRRCTATRLDERAFPWQQGLLPASWLKKWAQPFGQKRGLAFVQTLAMMIFCVGLSWGVATMLRPPQKTSPHVVENGIETALSPLSDGVPTEAGQRWLLGTGMTLACLEADSSELPVDPAVAGIGSENPRSPDLAEHSAAYSQLLEWPQVSHRTGVHACCSDCHHAKSSVIQSTTRIAALIGQTCMICHVPSTARVSASSID